MATRKGEKSDLEESGWHDDNSWDKQMCKDRLRGVTEQRTGMRSQSLTPGT